MNLLFREHCLRRARTTDGGVCHYRIIWIDYIRLDANDCVHLEAKCKFSYKYTTHGMGHYIFVYDGRDKNTNSQTNSSTKYILNTCEDVMYNEI